MKNTETALSEQITLIEYLDWLLTHRNYSESTKEHYAGLINRHIRSHNIAEKLLVNVNKVDIVEFYESYLMHYVSPRTQQTYSNKTLKSYYTALNTFFNYAVRLELIYENPMSIVQIKKKDKKLMDNYYTVSEVREMMRYFDELPTKYQLAFLLAVCTGKRRGELSALQWKDVDREHCCLKISKSLCYANKKSYIKSTKTDMESTVSFPKCLLALFQVHWQEELCKKQELISKENYQGNSIPEENYVFTGKTGARMSVQTISKRFHKFLKDHHLRMITFHGLRHTSATILLENKISLLNVSKRLNHADPDTTVRYYAHFSERVDEECNEIFADIIKPNM